MKNCLFILNVFMSCFCMTIIGGCGFYSMAGSIPPHIKSIAIPLLENQTAEYGISEDITDNLLDKFTEENILSVVDIDYADSILRGTIVKVEDKASTFSKKKQCQNIGIQLFLEWSGLM